MNIEKRSTETNHVIQQRFHSFEDEFLNISSTDDIDLNNRSLHEDGSNEN